MTSPQTVVILGGGIGGLATARALRRRLSRRHRIILVDRERQHVFAPSLLWLMTGQRWPEQLQRPLTALAPRGVELLVGEVERIEPEARRVILNGRPVEWDYLVISLGAELAPEAIPGLREAGYNLYDLPGAVGLRDALAAHRAGRVVVLTAAPAYKCPAAPYEAAFLIADALHIGSSRAIGEVAVYAAEPGPMGVAGPEVSGAIRQLLQARQIPYFPEHQVTEVDPLARRITFANGARTEFDLLAYVPPHRAPGVVRESGLTTETGWIGVDRHTLETGFPRVYAIGDVVSIPLSLGKPLPKAGVFAHGQAKVVAKNIAGLIAGQPTAQRFDGHGECFVEVGGGRAGFGTGNFYAEPTPTITLRPPSWRWHLGKVLLEKLWLRRW
jgi:sulfide:quinone oxidoreductase